MTNIFANTAPLYWASGIPAIPLKKRDKFPVIDGWQTYGSQMPIKAVQDLWLSTWADGNIGLPLGEQSGLCIIDIDTEDPELAKAIEDMLPESPWRRVGAKGCALAYRWQGQRNFNIRDSSGMIVEFLGQGRQIVLPPSIHPDTGKPYVASSELWEVAGDCPVLGEDIQDRMRKMLSGRGIKLSHEGRSLPLEVVPAGERDVRMTREAGFLARVVEGIDKRKNYTLQEAIDQMTVWVEKMTAKVADDEMDPRKGIAKLLEFLLRDVDGGRTLPTGWDGGLRPEFEELEAVQALREKNQSERWTYQKVRDWLEINVIEMELEADDAMEKVQELMAKVVRDDHFGRVEFEAVIPLIRRALGEIKLSKTGLNQMLVGAQEREGEDAGEETHAVIARRLLENYSRGGALRFHQGSFYWWSGSCWLLEPHEAIYREITTMADGSKLVHRHSDYDSVVQAMSRLAEQGLPGEEIPGVNFANGFLDANGELHEHDPAWGRIFTLPFNYAPERVEECQKWLGMLERLWGDDPDYAEKVAALQEAMAATIFGVAPSYQRAVILVGRPGSGKSQILEIVRKLLPPSMVATIGPELWQGKHSTSELTGKVLNICGELPTRKLIPSHVFKGIITGDPQRGERKYRDAYTFIPRAAHWFGSNHYPRSDDTSRGFTRRWLVLECNGVITAEERITDYAEEVYAEEREAIAAWAVQGMARLVRQGDYTMPKSAVKAQRAMLLMNSSVASFLKRERGRIRKEEGGTVDLEKLFNAYVHHQRNRARKEPLGIETFAAELRALEYEIDEVEGLDGSEVDVVRGLVMDGGFVE